MPFFSAVTQIGSPLYQRPSSTLLRSDSLYQLLRVSSGKRLLTMPCSDG